MARLRRQQVYAIFMLVMLFGAWIVASALMSVVDVGQQTQQLVFYQPLTNADEAIFLKQNMVILKYFWSADCATCNETDTMVDTLFQDFNQNSQRLVIEKIDIDQLPDAVDAFSVSGVPEIQIKGYTEDYFDGNVTYEDAYSRVCALFFEPVEECQNFA